LARPAPRPTQPPPKRARGPETEQEQTGTGNFAFSLQYSQPTLYNVKPLSKNITNLGQGGGRRALQPKYSRGDTQGLKNIMGRPAPLANAALHAHITHQMEQLLYASLAKNSWAKYRSGWRAFFEFEKEAKQTFTWPLQKETVRAFAVYCIVKKKLKPSSVKTYLSALVCLHKVKGYTDYDLKDELVNSILKGANNLLMSAPVPWTNRRRVVTLPLLRHIGHKLAQSGWSEGTKQCIWTACITAFFGSARMGELLPESETAFDPTTTLTWGQVNFREDDSILLFLRMPKSGQKEGEYIDVFTFPGTCCPVRSLHSHLAMQKKLGFGRMSDPVFTLPSGNFLTPTKLNAILKTLLSDIIDYKKDTISCHSFRAGIPSTLSRFPDMASAEDIKSWGRWSSSCYQTYSRLKLDQKREIFRKIAAALRR